MPGNQRMVFDNHSNHLVKSNETLVSIVLPVYNGSMYLQEAMDSILAQTYSNFELIIIDDGSSDNSAEIIVEYTDSRIKFYRQENHGLAATLNRCISIASGSYVARQDQDDISLPSRLEKQVAFLESNPDYGMVGTWATIWEGNVPTERLHKHSPENLRLKFDLLFDNPFVHSSMMIRKCVFDIVGGYSTDRDRQPPEDYELWSRVSRKFKVANIPEVLHVYREIPQSMSRTGENPFLRHILNINKENLAWATSGKYSDQEYMDLAALIHAQYQLFSRKTPLKEMIAIIHSAAQSLADAAGVDRSAIQEEMQSRCNNLSYHYCQSRYFGLLGDSGRSLLNRTLRSCRKLVQRK